ncbi:MAG: hypothetical protein HZB55_13270 [Deltaproteobacteria bacterium]|nr:hypothetical protein [Deltaproteobacteria bacterium]
MVILPTAFALGQEVVVHPRVAVEALSRNEARAIFGMRLRQWRDGSRIVVFVLPDTSPTHISFAKSQLDIFPHQLRRAWDRLVFSGTGQAPIEVRSEEEMRAKVATTDGAIGYLRKEDLNATVRVLQIR